MRNKARSSPSFLVSHGINEILDHLTPLEARLYRLYCFLTTSAIKFAVGCTISYLVLFPFFQPVMNKIYVADMK